MWTPESIPGLSVAADYYDIEITDAVGSLWSGFVIWLCAQNAAPAMCSLIHRDEVGSLWLTDDGYVDETLQNIGRLNAEGVDLNLSYLIGLGDAGYLNVGLIGT